MRYKESTLSKLEAQSMKLKTLQRAIENADMSAKEAILFINQIICIVCRCIISIYYPIKRIVLVEYRIKIFFIIQI